MAKANSITLDEPAVFLGFSPSGQQLAVSNASGTIKLYQPDSLSLDGEIFTATAQCLCYSPDGRLLALQRDEQTVVVLDSTSLEVTAEIPSGRVTEVRCLSFSPDGTLLVVAGVSGRGKHRTGIVKIWNPDTGEPVREIQKFVDEVPRMAFYPDGKTLVLLSLGHGFILWDTDTWEEIKRMETFVQEVADFTPDAGRLIVFTRGYEIALFDTQTSIVEKRFGETTCDPPAALAWAPDARVFAIGFYDGSIYPWDVERNEPQTLAFTGSAVRSLTYSIDGRRLVSSHAHGELACWDVSAIPQDAPAPRGSIVEIDEARVIKRKRGKFVKVNFSPDGRLLVTSGLDAYFRLWDVETLEQHWASGTRYHPLPVFTPDGNQIMAQYDAETVRYFDVETKEIVKKMELPERQVFQHAVFTPDGKTFITVANDGVHGVLCLWDVAAAELILGETRRNSAFRQIAMTRDGQKFYTATKGFIRLWNTAPLEELKSVPIGTMCVAIAVTPEGDAVFATAGWARNSEIRRWTPDLELRGTILAHDPKLSGTWLSISPDGQTLASGGADSLVKLWHVATMEQKAVLRGHLAGIDDVAFAPDGKTLASASNQDNTIRLWDVSEVA